MGLVLGLKIGGVIATAVEVAKKAATRTALSDTFVVLPKVKRGQLTPAAHAAVKEVVEELAELALEAAATGVAESIMEIYPDLTTVTTNPSTFVSCSIKYLQGYNDLERLIVDFSVIIVSFKTASLDIDSANNERNQAAFKDCLSVLKKTERQMKLMKDELEKLCHNEQMIEVEESVVPLALVNALLPIIAGMAYLKRLAEDVEKQNEQGKPITKIQLYSLKQGLDKITNPLMQLACYMEQSKFPTFINTEDKRELEKMLKKRYCII